MRRFQALVMALEIARNPTLLQRLQRAPLPDGMTLLLEIAANNADALTIAEARTHKSAKTLRAAANFFVEQVMLTDAKADSYRVLGCHRDAAYSELRKHMALLMTWLHPDVAAKLKSDHAFDRSRYANRITAAWENVKTDERRRQYDQAVTRSAKKVRKVHRRRHRKSNERSTSNRSKPRVASPAILDRLRALVSAFGRVRRP